MALKKQFEMSATFSMASMTDVIFLLLIFFMVTSTFVFPNALEVNLPESASKTTLKPSARVYIDAEGKMVSMYGEEDVEVYEHADIESLRQFFILVKEQNTPEVPITEGVDMTEEAPVDSLAPTAFIALYADKEVPYGSIVEVLNLGAENQIKVVLATSIPESLPAQAQDASTLPAETPNEQ